MSCRAENAPGAPAQCPRAAPRRLKRPSRSLAATSRVIAFPSGRTSVTLGGELIVRAPRGGPPSTDAGARNRSPSLVNCRTAAVPARVPLEKETSSTSATRESMERRRTLPLVACWLVIVNLLRIQGKVSAQPKSFPREPPCKCAAASALLFVKLPDLAARSVRTRTLC